MNISTDNLKRKNPPKTLVKKNKEKKNNFFTKMEIKTSRNLDDINERSFNISNMPFITYTNKSKKVKNQNLRRKVIENILLDNFPNLNTFEKSTTYTNNLKSINKSKKMNNSFNNNQDKSSRLKIKTKKRVNFKKNFATIIKVESYKKYNVNNYINNIECINCSCIIY